MFFTKLTIRLERLDLELFLATINTLINDQIFALYWLPD